MSWKKLVWILITLSLLRGAFSLAAQTSPRLYDEKVVKEYFSGEYVKKATVYKERRLVAQRFTVPAQIFIELFFIFGGPLLWLHRRLTRTRLSAAWQSVAIIAAMILFSALLRLPVSFKFGYLIEKEFGFSNQSPPAYLADYAKGTGIGIIFAGILTALFAWLYHKFERAWLWLTGIAFSAFSILTIFIIPVVVEPLFFDYHDLPKGSLRTKIEALAQSQNIHIDKILEMKASEKTNRTNAYVSGLWGSHRVVLFDNLMKKHSEDEIIAIVGHELGHSVLNHIWKNLALSIAFIWLSLPIAHWLIRRIAKIHPGPVAGRNIGVLLPVLLMIFDLGDFALEPVGSAISRHMEAEADYYALQVTKNPAAAVSMEIKLTQDNLSDPNPRTLPYLWYASHPDAISRIRMAREFAKKAGK